MSVHREKKSSIFFGLEVTRRCNLKCPHCFNECGIYPILPPMPD